MKEVFVKVGSWFVRLERYDRRFDASLRYSHIPIASPEEMSWRREWERRRLALKGELK